MLKKIYEFFKKLFKMIYVGDDNIKSIGAADTIANGVYVGDTLVWPSDIDFYYTLVFYARIYSDTSTNKVHANGNDYCMFSCKYSKFRKADSGLVQEDIVTTTPSADYFITNNDKLYFDYNNYKATEVSAGNKTVTLTYSGLSTTTTVDFAGNVYNNKSVISPVVPAVETVAASGGTITYTGGVVTNSKYWSSGYDEFVNTGMCSFNSTHHSQSGDFTGYVMPENRTIIIPSLETSVLARGTYTFTSATYNNVYITFTVGQLANAIESVSNTYAVYNGATDTAISDPTNISQYEGNMKFYIKTVETTYYSSNASTSSTYNLSNTSWTASTGNDTYNMVQSFTRSNDGKNMVVNYRPNQQESNISCNIMYTTGSTYAYAFQLAQEATSVYYTLTFSARTYSNGSSIHATGSDYCEFKCKYNKYRTSDSGLVSSTLVTATPSATYFTASGTKLYYNYNSYKATTVNAGNYTATLTYNGLSTTATFAFAGNTSTNVSSISPVVPSVETVAASGGTISYTGGVITTNKNWSSGYQQFVSSGKSEFNTATHSKNSGFVGSVVTANSKIIIPSLGTTVVAAGTYTFTSSSYAGYSFTIGQSANAITNTTNSYVVYDTSTDRAIANPYRIGGNADGSFKFYIKNTETNYYTSTASARTTYNLSNTSWTAGTSNDSHSIVNSFARYSDGKSMTVNYRANVEDYAVNCDITYKTGYTTTTAFQLIQSAASVYYTLTYQSKTYSSSDNKVHATGSDYCTFTCRYNKVRSTDDTVISYTAVTATPSATYFTNSNNKLYYNYNSYKGTEVSAGDKTVTLTYSGLSTTTTMAFAGNTYTTTIAISPVSFSGAGEASSNPVPASGRTISYTGGVVTTSRYWSSGYQDIASTQDAAFASVANSKSAAFVGVVNSTNKTINIPSLATTVLDPGYYAFVSNSYSGATTSFNVYQDNNTLTSSSTTYKFYDTGNTQITNVAVSSSSGTMEFYTKQFVEKHYKSGSSGRTETKLTASSYSVSYTGTAGGGCVQSVMAVSTYNYLVAYSPNSTRYQRISAVIATISGLSASFTVTQAASTQDIYELSTSVSSITVPAAASSITFTITSKKNGEAYTPSANINPNNIGGTISITGNGPTYTATLTYTENLSVSDQRTASIQVWQSGGQSVYISVTQQSAGENPFYGLTAAGTVDDRKYQDRTEPYWEYRWYPCG